MRWRWRSTLAAIGAFAVVVAPWTIRNAETFHALVPISTEDGFTLAGQYNASTAAATRFQAVWQLPLLVPSVSKPPAALYTRKGA